MPGDVESKVRVTEGEQEDFDMCCWHTSIPYGMKFRWELIFQISIKFKGFEKNACYLLNLIFVKLG